MIELREGLWRRTKRSEEEENGGGRERRKGHADVRYGMLRMGWDVWYGMFGLGCRCGEPPAFFPRGLFYQIDCLGMGWPVWDALH